MNTQAKYFAVAIFAIVLGVFGFCVKRDHDKQTEVRITIADSVRKVQAKVLDTAQKKTDSASHDAEVSARSVAHADTVWLTRKVVVNQAVAAIVHDSLIPDTVKIHELVTQIGMLEADADTLRAVNERLLQANAAFRLAAANERTAATAEIQTATSEIGLLKKLSRHVGLVVSGGYGPQREHDGAIRLGWNAHLGIGYRF
jgi:hypothetical protein